MKAIFYLRDEDDNRLEMNGKAIHPSKNFSQELKKQVLNEIISNIELFFPSDSILIEYSNKINWSLIDHAWVGGFNNISVFFVKTFTLFTFDIYWKSKKNIKIHPIDEIDGDDILFWADRIPTRQILEEKSSRFKTEIDYFTQKKNKANKKYNFLFAIKSIGEVSILSIQSAEPLVSIENMLSESINSWNTNQKNGLIHNYYYDENKSTPSKKIFIINWGSSDESALDFILNKLNKSDLSIKKIILDSL